MQFIDTTAKRYLGDPTVVAAVTGAQVATTSPVVTVAATATGPAVTSSAARAVQLSLT